MISSTKKRPVSLIDTGLIISFHFSIITDVPDLKRNSIKTSHTFTSFSSFLTSVPSNFVLVRGWELMKLQSACIRSRCSALAASSIVFCSCCSRSRSISSTRSSYLRQKPPNHCMMIERFSFWKIHIYLHFNTDRHARLEPELQVVVVETIFLLLTRTTAPSRELTSFITLYRLFFV